jgi:hypothetical protein
MESQTRQKIEIVEGIRIPALRCRVDGRWSVRYTQNGKRVDRYFETRGDAADLEADAERQYRSWRIQFLRARLSPPGIGADHPPTNLHPDSSLQDLINAFVGWVDDESTSAQSKRRERGAFGNHTKQHYAAKDMVVLLGSILYQPESPRFSDLCRARSREIEHTLRLLAALPNPWSRNKADRALRMLKSFATWVQETTSKLSGSEVLILADKVLKSSAFQSLKWSTRTPKGPQPTLEEFQQHANNLEKDTFFSILLNAQLANASRPSEVLAIRRDYMTPDRNGKLKFGVPHKTERRTRKPKLLEFGGQLANRLRLLMEIAGDNPIFTTRMRRCLAKGWGTRDELTQRYIAAKGNFERSISPDSYRKMMQRRIKGAYPYHVRIVGITTYATKCGSLKAAALANHLDTRQTERYVRYSPHELGAVFGEAQSLLAPEPHGDSNK